MNEVNYKTDLDHLYLHDCIIEDLEWDGKDLILYFESIDVLPEYSNNPFENAKCAEQAKIVFKNCIATNAIKYGADKIKGSDVVKMNLQDLAIDFEILKVEYQNIIDKKYIYTVTGQCSFELNSDFGEFTLGFESIDVEWERLEEDSWFLDFEDDE